MSTNRKPRARRRVVENGADFHHVESYGAGGRQVTIARGALRSWRIGKRWGGTMSAPDLGSRASPAGGRRARERNWKRFGPYLSERQWGTVREDYSPIGTCWDYFPHDHARSRAYRWGEDGLLGFCDRRAGSASRGPVERQDPILKERLFGLAARRAITARTSRSSTITSTPPHATPTAARSTSIRSARIPTTELVCEESAAREALRARVRAARHRRLRGRPVLRRLVEYAKASPDDILIQITAANRGPGRAPALLPTLWFPQRLVVGPQGRATAASRACSRGRWLLRAPHAGLGRTAAGRGIAVRAARRRSALALHRERDQQRALFGGADASPYVKDAFHEYVVQGLRIG
jgi:hypothetical protein